MYFNDTTNALTCCLYIGHLNHCQEISISFRVKNVHLNLILNVTWSTKIYIETLYSYVESTSTRSHVARAARNMYLNTVQIPRK